MKAPTDLDSLIGVLEALTKLPPLQLAILARALDRIARAILGEAGDEAVFQATRTMSHVEVAEGLGVSTSRISGAITRYYRHHRITKPRGRPSKAEALLARTALYRFFDSEGVLLYVGVTVSVPTRIYQHRYDKPWWADVARVEVTWYETRTLALEAEAEAIRVEAPLYNRAADLGR